MDWFELTIFIVSIALLAIFLPRPKKLGAATNALLAEHLLSYVELVPENPWAKTIAENILLLLRPPGLPNTKTSMLTESFNGASRFVQLNIIAMALNRMHHPPMLPDEIWRNIKDPFSPGLEDATHLQAVADRLKWNKNTEVQIPNRRFQIKPWGLSDNDTVGNDKPARTESFQAPPPVPFSASLPDVTKCEALRIYEIGNYVALVVENPKPYAAAAGFDLHVVEYIYAMVVSNANPPGPPLLFVTAERSGSDLTAMLNKATGHQHTLDPFLCVFDSTGAHHNLGSSSDFTDLGIFSAYALKVARDRLRIQEEAVERH